MQTVLQLYALGKLEWDIYSSGGPWQTAPFEARATNQFGHAGLPVGQGAFVKVGVVFEEEGPIPSTSQAMCGYGGTLKPCAPVLLDSDFMEVAGLDRKCAV